MSTVTTYSNNAELSLAAYSDFYNGMNQAAYEAALRQDGDGMSPTQAADFASQWRVVEQSNPTVLVPVYDSFGYIIDYIEQSIGLSATVFESVSTGERYLAVRGTDDLSDVWTDFVDIALLGTPEYQTQYAALSDQVGAWLSDGTLTSGFTVTGHSLGGFLAGALLVDYPTEISHAYLYNAPGVGGLSAGLRLLAGRENEPTLDLTKVSNLISEAGFSVTAGLGLDWGTPVPVMIEDQSPNVLDNHSIVPLTDSLAVHALLGELSTTASMNTLGDILRAATNQNDMTLEATVNALGDLFEAGVTITGNEEDVRNALYLRIQTIEASAGYLAAQQVADFVQVVSLAGLSGDQIAEQAATDIAYRYTLVNLMPFVITGDAALYAPHNGSGELDLYDPLTREGDLTTAYLDDRAEMLSLKIKYDSGVHDYNDLLFIGDKAYSDEWDSGAPGDWHFVDYGTQINGAPLSLFIDGVGDSIFATDPDHQILFGSGDADALAGQDTSDNLYGNAGQDILYGNQGGDYLEGGRDEDLLVGGLGDDHLEGGQGHDTYVYRTGDGVDAIVDVDGAIHFDGVVLEGGAASETDADTFISDDGKFTYTRVETTSGTDVWINDAVKIQNYHPGDLGIVLGDPVEEPIQYLNVSLQDLIYDNPQSDYIPGSDGVVRSWSRYEDFNRVGVYDTSYDPPRQLLAITVEGEFYPDYGGETRTDWAFVSENIVAEVEDWNIVTVGGIGGDRVTTGEGSDYVSTTPARPFIDGTDSLEDVQIIAGWYVYVPAEAGPDYVDTGAGRDSVHTDGGDDTIFMGSGQDAAAAGDGDDSVDGGDDGDLLSGGSGNDIMQGGSGDDLIYGDSYYIPYSPDVDIDWRTWDFTLSFTVSQDGNHMNARYDLYNVYIGTNTQPDGNDILYGGQGTDAIFGEGGNDILSGDEDVDSLEGGADNDLLMGGVGDDWLWGDDVKDVAITGDDTLLGEAGVDHLYGGAGNDVLFGGEDGDQLKGDDMLNSISVSGNDALYGEGGDDELIGGPGDDYLDGGAGSDSLWGDLDHRFPGMAGNDILIGGAGDDYLDGGTGTDVLYGGEGDDIYVVDDASDVIAENDAEGVDTVLVSFDYILPNNIENIAVLSSAVANATGSAGANRLFGSEFTNTLAGLEGDDALFGRAGNDVLNGGAGVDRLFGEDGNDRLSGGAQNDTLYGGTGNDVYIANLGGGTDGIVDLDATNTVEFGPGIARSSLDVTQYQGDDGAYYLRIDYGSSGDAILIKDGLSGVIQSYRFDDGSTVTHQELVGQDPVPFVINGTVRNDIIHGSTAADRIDGGLGNDQIFGSAGADIVFGGQGADVLYGDADDDVLDGGVGDDTLSGGGGADRFVLQWGMGSDLIIEDGADLSTLVLGSGVQLSDLDIWRDQNDLLVRFTGSDEGVRIQGYASAPQNWHIQETSGATHVLDDQITQPPSTGTPLDFAAVSSRYTNTARSNFINTLVHPGESTGYTMGADGVLHRTTSEVTDYYSFTSHASARFQVEGIAAGDAAYTQSTPTYSYMTASSQDVIRVASTMASLGVVGGISSYGYGSSAYHAFNSGVSYGIPAGAGVVMVYGPAIDQTGGQNVQLDSYTGDIGAQQPVGVWVFDDGAETGISTTVVHDIASLDATLTLGNVVGGVGDNAITVNGHAVVDGGDGSDLIVANADRWEFNYGNDFAPDRYGFTGEFDNRNIGALLYGNNGADQIVGGGSNDLLIGGSDGDYLDGRAGEDVYVVRLGEGGYDVIADSGKFIKVQNETGQSRYADWYYQSIGMPDYVDRLLQGETLPELPARSPNDFAEMVQLSQAGVIETDTVEFSEGIALDQLTFTWGELVLESPVSLVGYQEPAWMDDLGTAFRTLDISWADGEGVRIVIPHTYVAHALDPGDEPLEGVSAFTFNRSDEYLGLGIEQFRFADGTTLSMADVVALAPQSPSFDPHLQDPDMLLMGTSGDDQLIGGNGNDTLDGLEGADQMSGNAGDDTYYVEDAGDIVTELSGQGTDVVNSSISYTLTAEVEYLTLTGAEAIDGTGNELSNILLGNDEANVLSGDAGGDVLFGMAGDDRLHGGAGNDVLETGYGFDYAYGGVGNDTITGGDNVPGTWTAEYLYGEDGDDLIQGGGKYAHLYGGAGNDELRVGSGYQNMYGEDGDDLLIAGTGSCQLNGGAGADRMVGNTLGNNYWIDNIGDVIVDSAGGGADTAYSNISYTLGDDVENLYLIGAAAISGTGNAGNNALTGNNNAAANVLAGGLSDDTYTVGAGDSVLENVNAGTDTVFAAFSYTLGDNVENLTLTSSVNNDATGNGLNNRLVGNGYNNTLSGGAGNDYLSGASGNDVLNGGSGADEMLGGLGNDTYSVDAAGDVVTELSGQGTDTVNSAINYTLTANVDRLTLTGTVAIDGTGNTLSNIATGNGAANVLSGDAGNDTLRGMAGNDSLFGGSGNDTLVGGWGSDQYGFARGDGQDLLNDYDAKDANLAIYGQTTDVLQLGPDIAHDQLWFSRLGNDLLVQVIGTGDQVQIQGWYLGEAYQIETIYAGDGYNLINDQVDQLVQAMAAFAPPTSGKLDLPAIYRPELDPVIAVNWQAA